MSLSLQLIALCSQRGGPPNLDKSFKKSRICMCTRMAPISLLFGIRAPAGDLRSPVRARAIWPTSGRGARHAGCSLRTALPGAGRDKKEKGKLELPGRRPGRPAAGGNLETLPKCIVLSVTLTLALVGFLVTTTQAIMKNNN